MRSGHGDMSGMMSDQGMDDMMGGGHSGHMRGQGNGKQDMRAECMTMMQQQTRSGSTSDKH